ncbi:MAG: VOC family protein [Thermoplasmatales archaeon]|nr:MAG: VOC family protein [Thermoplasmatales archaeon]
MLVNAQLVATVPVVDLERARRFYEEKLDLNLCEINEQGIVFEAGDETQLYLYKRDQTKADHTVASFLVEDIETEVKRLKEKGVVFEEYDSPQIKTINSIATTGEYKSAWFKDTEGNILAVTKKIS